MTHLNGPWDRVTQAVTSSHLRHDVVAAEFLPAPSLSEGAFQAIFSGMSGLEDGMTLYALLDGARSAFLPDRLAASGLEHACLYEADFLEDDGDSAPWLVALMPDAKFTRACFIDDPETDDPRNMFGDGIWVSSTLPLHALRAHLRRYTKLSDEGGAAQFFRLQEPGMLDGILSQSAAPAQAAFFSAVAGLYYPWPSLTEGRWDLVRVGLGQPEPRGLDQPRFVPPLIDTSARRALADFVNDRAARLMAVRLVANPSERRAACEVFFRLLRAGFDHEPRLLEAYEVLKACPPEAAPAFWREVESGEHSLRRILLIYCEHYNIQGILESFDE